MKNLLIIVFSVLALGVFAQTPQKNGTLYKEHPYITVANNRIALILKQDWAGVLKLYADTAKFYGPAGRTWNLSQEKDNLINIVKEWNKITIIKQKGSYPDGLEFAKDGFQVIDYIVETAVNKKTGKIAKVPMAIFYHFNKAGKISSQINYYDQTSIIEAMK